MFGIGIAVYISMKTTQTKGGNKMESKIFYDYEKQAWVENYRYIACNHPKDMDCKCYSRDHAGELVDTLYLKEEWHIK